MTALDYKQLMMPLFDDEVESFSHDSLRRSLTEASFVSFHHEDAHFLSIIFLFLLGCAHFAGWWWWSSRDLQRLLDPFSTIYYAWAGAGWCWGRLRLHISRRNKLHTKEWIDCGWPLEALRKPVKCKTERQKGCLFHFFTLFHPTNCTCSEWRNSLLLSALLLLLRVGLNVLKSLNSYLSSPSHFDRLREDFTAK